MKKLFAVVLALALALLTLGGCGQAPAQSGSGAPAAPASQPGKTASLDFIWFSDGNEGNVMQKIIDEYEAATPGITINLISVPFADLHTKITNLIQGGTPPALARTDGMTRYYEYCLPLNDTFGDTDAFAGQYYDSIRNYFTKDGEIVCLPHDTTANGMLYNKTLFDKAGVKVPQSEDEIWTWDEFIAAVKTVQQKTGCQYGVVWDGNGHRYTSMLYEWGGRIFSDDYSKMLLNEPAAIDCLTYFKQQFDDGVFDTSVWLGGENPNNLFRTGNAAVHIAGNWMVGNYNDITDFEWGATYMPIKETRATVPGGKYIVGFDGTGVEAETKAFIEYLAKPEVTARYCEETMLISPRKDQTTLNWAARADDLKIFSQELLASPAFTGNDFSYPGMSAIFVDYHTNIIKTIMGEMTPEEAMNAIVILGEDYIAQQK